MLGALAATFNILVGLPSGGLTLSDNSFSVRAVRLDALEVNVSLTGCRSDGFLDTGLMLAGIGASHCAMGTESVNVVSTGLALCSYSLTGRFWVWNAGELERTEGCFSLLFQVSGCAFGDDSGMSISLENPGKNLSRSS